MLKLYDYLPSHNAWKVRALLAHLGRPYETVSVSIFAGESHRDDFLAKNPAGAVPVLEIAPGEYIAESNAILFHFAEGSPYLPPEHLSRTRVLQWLFFEQDYVQSTIATLRHWALTGKLGNREPRHVAARRAGGEGALAALERHLATQDWLAAGRYTIADIAVFAYTHLAGDAGFELRRFPAVQRWIERVAARPEGLPPVHPYSIDPLSARELS